MLEAKRRKDFFAQHVAATRLGMIGSADAQSSKTTPADVTTIKPGTKTSFGLLKQIDAGVLNVGYAEAGQAGDFWPGVMAYSKNFN